MNENLNASQVKQINDTMVKAVAHAIEEMKLRRWSMEQALGIFSSPGMQIDPGILMILAAEIYAFVAKPALELVAKPDK